jgi:hypothetical protein
MSLKPHTEAQQIDHGHPVALGLCPVCKKADVFAFEKVYACRHYPMRCNFHVSKITSQCEIPREQMQKLITTGKTDLLTGFISQSGFPFSAALKLENGKFGFDFGQGWVPPKRQLPPRFRTWFKRKPKRPKKRKKRKTGNDYKSIVERFSLT